MSPSEFELRDALRDGEGDGIDVGALIAHAEGVRRTRRVRWASAAAAVIVVGGVATGVGVGTSGTTHHRQLAEASTAAATSAANASTNFGVNANGQAQAGGGAAVPSAKAAVSGSSAARTELPIAAAPAFACPDKQPGVVFLAPGAATTGSMFREPVTAILACAYSTAGTLLHTKDGVPVTATYTGGDSAAIVSSIGNAATTASNLNCAPGADTLTFFATYASGGSETLEALSCGTVTNGTAARYGWTPPRQLDALEQLATRALSRH
jgi:hypothetical protein